MLEKIKQLDDKYETIQKNRVQFVKRNIPITEMNLLIKWGAFDLEYDRYCHPSEEYIEYLCTQKGIPRTIQKYIMKKKKKKKIELENPRVENLKGFEINVDKDLSDILKISYWNGIYSDGSLRYEDIKKLSYGRWQEFKEVIFLIKECFEPFIFEKQKKIICNLTDCYKEGIKTRICELCGNEVTEDAVYCSECGKKFK